MSSLGVFADLYRAKTYEGILAEAFHYHGVYPYLRGYNSAVQQKDWTVREQRETPGKAIFQGGLFKVARSLRKKYLLNLPENGTRTVLINDPSQHSSPCIAHTADNKNREMAGR